MRPFILRFCAIMTVPLLSGLPNALLAATAADTIIQVKKSIVAVGTMQKRRAPQFIIRGTGFSVAPGGYIITNAHVVIKPVDSQNRERLVVFTRIGKNSDITVKAVKILETDPAHDLALLEIQGETLPGLQIGVSDHVREGEEFLFTGFPLGNVLGLFPSTHQAMIASITPLAIPLDSARQLNARVISRLREPFNIFQLDAVAYPGNSGSPLYGSNQGEVIGVINMVLVKKSKEHVLSAPSGIAYAIPAKYIDSLIAQSKQKKTK